MPLRETAIFFGWSGHGPSRSVTVDYPPPFWLRVVLLVRLSVAQSVDVLANDPVVVSSDSEWDYEERPSTQLSLKRSLEEARESYCAATWAAPATPADSPVNQDLSHAPRPFRKCGDRAFLLGTFLARISAMSVLGRFLFCGHCAVVSGFPAMLAMPLFMKNASTALLRSQRMGWALVVSRHSSMPINLCIYPFVKIDMCNVACRCIVGLFFPIPVFFSCSMWFSSVHSLCFALHVLEEGWGMWR